MMVCYFFTLLLPNIYVSRGSAVMGIADKTSQLIDREQPVRGSEMEHTFDNLIQSMKMKPVMDQVSYALLSHDLTVPPDSFFRAPSGELKILSVANKQKVAAFLTQKQRDILLTGPTNKRYQARLKSVNSMVRDMKYDASSLLEKLRIERLGNSDYLEVEYEAEDPRLTAFVVNALFAKFREVSAPGTLTVAERATLGEKEPSKKLIMAVVAGLVAFLLCLTAFSITYFLDNTVRTPAQLADVTGMPVLGRINRTPDGKGLQGISDLDATDESTLLLKDLVRSVRYEIDEKMINPKIIAIVSLQAQAGKSDLAYGLAWAYARIGQRVLVIDGNFSNPFISRQTKAKADLSDFFTSQDSFLYPEQVDFLATAGGNISLLEITDEKMLREKFTHLKEQYDIILIETPALTASSQAKEWLAFADRIVAVFGYGGVMKADEKSKLDYLRSRGEQFSGWVLTGTTDKAENSGRRLTKI